MPHAWLTCDERLDDEVVDLRLETFNIVPFVRYVLVDLIQGPLVTPALAFLVLILLVVVGILVDGVVRQVHEHIVQVFWVRRLVLRGGKASQAFIEDVYAQRTDAVEEDVDAEIKLQSINEVWVLDVPLGDHVIVRVHIVDGVRKVNSTALTLAFWLDDVNWQLFLFLRRRLSETLLLLFWVGRRFFILALRKVRSLVHSEFIERFDSLI